MLVSCSISCCNGEDLRKISFLVRDIAKADDCKQERDFAHYDAVIGESLQRKALIKVEGRNGC